MLASSCSKYKYETVSGDPLKTRIYTLPNGLKVYMSVMKEQPRIQTAIAVRVGGKNDPAETTGLAHYFEHLMLIGNRGNSRFGNSLVACSTAFWCQKVAPKASDRVKNRGAVSGFAQNAARTSSRPRFLMAEPSPFLFPDFSRCGFVVRFAQSDFLFCARCRPQVSGIRFAVP